MTQIICDTLISHAMCHVKRRRTCSCRGLCAVGASLGFATYTAKFFLATHKWIAHKWATHKWAALVSGTISWQYVRLLVPCKMQHIAALTCWPSTCTNMPFLSSSPENMNWWHAQLSSTCSPGWLNTQSIRLDIVKVAETKRAIEEWHASRTGRALFDQTRYIIYHKLFLD